MLEMPSSKATFDCYVVDDIIVIIDLHDSINNSKSVTNDIENVLAVTNVMLRDIDGGSGVDGRKIIYRDTDLTYDEIDHDNGVFRNFKPLNTASVTTALEKVSNG